jgi:alanine racemase
MKATSHIELSEKALRKNLGFLRSIIGDECILSSVVKGNAYGHGLEEFVPLAEQCGIDHFSVFSAEEAFRVRQSAGNNCRIMIMGMIDPSDLEWVIQHDIEFFVFDSGRVEAARTISKRLGKPARIHLELETGMNRSGFGNKDLDRVAHLITSDPSCYRVEGLCTHYAGAESIANYLRVQRQIKKFGSLAKKLETKGIHPLMRHTACSAAAMTYPKTRMDLVRNGIMQYGYWPSVETLMNYLGKRQDKSDPLDRVISWKSTIMNVKSVSAGEFIGYGTTYLATHGMRIAVIPVGYAEGYSRSLSNQGRVLIHGERVGVIGIVNMNMLIADITGIPQARIGDEVVLVGRQGDRVISVASFSELSDQLNYELLTRLPSDIPRIVTQ